jgi:periplasmic protein CpxP/Spy
MESKKIQVLKWSVIILVVLNILMLVQNFMKPSQKHNGMMPPHEGPSARIKEDLGLTDEQMKTFEVLKADHQRAMRDFHEQGRDLRDRYFELLKSDVVDAVAKAELEKRISENQIQIEQITFDHFKKVRELCEDEQKKKFDDAIQHILRGMRHQGPPPPPHP